jgi:hypothetical protein
MSALVFERIITAKIRPWRCRLWLKADDMGVCVQERICEQMAFKVMDRLAQDDEHLTAATAIQDILDWNRLHGEPISAAEVTNVLTECGSLCYPDWP